MRTGEAAAEVGKFARQVEGRAPWRSRRLRGKVLVKPDREERPMSLQAILARAPSRVTFLLAFAALELTIALTLAWVLGVTLFFPSGQVAAAIVDRGDLIRGHIDFLMMSQFLFLFALLFRQYRLVPPLWVVGACCFGAFVNPLSFVMRALSPKVDPATIVEHFPVLAAVSFTLTTVGFLASAVLAARASWRQANQATHPKIAELETL
jgi:hypothetical protein